MGNYKYFIYSSSQLKERTDIEKRIGSKFIPGTVVVGATKQQFTELSDTGNSRYSDAKIVTEGDIDKMNYTNISSRPGA